MSYPKKLKALNAIVYKSQTIAICKHFALSFPWRGSLEQRKLKFTHFHEAICRVYDVNPRLHFKLGVNTKEKKCQSDSNNIFLYNKLSVVVYLYNFAKVLGKNEKEASEWSWGLFQKCFPKEFKNQFKGKNE